MGKVTKNQDELRQVYVACYMTNSNIYATAYEGYMKKVDEVVTDTCKDTKYIGYLHDANYNEYIGIFLKSRGKDSFKEKSRYYLFSKNNMTDPICVVIGRDMRSNAVESNGQWGNEDVYGIDNTLYFNPYGDAFAYDVLVKDESREHVEDLFAEKEELFAPILEDSKRNYKFYQFLNIYDMSYNKPNSNGWHS